MLLQARVRRAEHGALMLAHTLFTTWMRAGSAHGVMRGSIHGSFLQRAEAPTHSPRAHACAHMRGRRRPPLCALLRKPRNLRSLRREEKLTKLRGAFRAPATARARTRPKTARWPRWPRAHMAALATLTPSALASGSSWLRSSPRLLPDPAAQRRGSGQWLHARPAPAGAGGLGAGEKVARSSGAVRYACPFTRPARLRRGVWQHPQRRSAAGQERGHAAGVCGAHPKSARWPRWPREGLAALKVSPCLIPIPSPSPHAARSPAGRRARSRRTCRTFRRTRSPRCGRCTRAGARRAPVRA